MLLAAGAIIVAALAFLHFSRDCDDSLFQSDAADYLRAADGGFGASYFDTRSIGLWGTIALLKVHPDVRTHLWDFLNRENDSASARHFHVAPGFYGNAVAREMGASNRDYRLIMAGAGAIAIGILFAGLQMAGVPWWVAAVAAILSILSPAVNTISTDVSPHAPFLGCMLAAAFALARFLKTESRLWGVLFGVALAGVLATCELSIVVIATFSLIFILQTTERGMLPVLRSLRLPAIAFVCALTAFWPGGVFKGSYGLSYGVFLFQAVFRRTAYFGNMGGIETVLRGVQGSYLIALAVVILAVAVISLLALRRGSPYLQVFSLLAVGFFTQGILNRFHNSTYVAHFVVLLWAVFALGVSEWMQHTPGGVRRNTALAALSFALVLVGVAATQWPGISARRHLAERTLTNRAAEILREAALRIPRGQTVLTNSRPEIWHLYLQGRRIEQSSERAQLGFRPWVKTPSDYWAIADSSLLKPEEKIRLNLMDSATVAGFIIAHVRH